MQLAGRNLSQPMEDAMTTNRHPVDELADVRAEIKNLQARESKLRETLLADDADLSGGEHFARIDVTKQKRLERKLLEKRFGKEAVAECCTEIVITMVRLVLRDFEDAA